MATTLVVTGLAGVSSTAEAADSSAWSKIKVIATSFTLAPDETKKGHIGVTSSGVKVKPTSKAIAVSRDLKRAGLDYGTKVRIKNLPGVYTVRDIMDRRWHHKIDILFAKKSRALKWGRKVIQIEYRVPDSD